AQRVRQRGQPRVVLVGVLRRRREKVNYRSHGALGIQNGASRSFVRTMIPVNSAEIHFENFGHTLDVVLKVPDEHWPFENYVGNGLRNLRLPSSGNGAWLMTQRSPRTRANQSPRRSARLFLHP